MKYKVFHRKSKDAELKMHYCATIYEALTVYDIANANGEMAVIVERPYDTIVKMNF